MEINSTYSVGQKVWILPLKCWARIVGIYIDRDGENYHCRWFDGNQTKKDYIYEDELAKEPETSGVGFGG